MTENHNNRCDTLEPTASALIATSMAAIAIIVWASQFTSQAKRDWDINSYADQQLEIRIHAYLASTMMVLVFTLQLMSLLLFVYNAERMLEFFATSAMTLSVAMMPPFGTPPI